MPRRTSYIHLVHLGNSSGISQAVCVIFLPPCANKLPRCTEKFSFCMCVARSCASGQFFCTRGKHFLLENWGKPYEVFSLRAIFFTGTKACELTNCELTGRSRVPIDCRQKKIKLFLSCSCPRLLFSFCKNYNRGSTGTYLSDGEFWCLPTFGG